MTCICVNIQFLREPFRRDVFPNTTLNNNLLGITRKSGTTWQAGGRLLRDSIARNENNIPTIYATEENHQTPSSIALVPGWWSRLG